METVDISDIVIVHLYTSGGGGEGGGERCTHAKYAMLACKYAHVKYSIAFG